MNVADLKPMIRRLPPILLFCGIFALYAATVAPGTLFGDPSEYQFIPAIGGIAHPPGYAFYTLLAKLWQTLVPLGAIPFRTNLLAAAVGAWTVTAVYLVVRDLGRGVKEVDEERVNEGPGEYARPHLPIPHLLIYSSTFAALSLAAAPDFWQHAIHANAHVVSAALAVTHLWLLIRWWHTGRDRWLAAFVFTLGLAAAHHPITLMGVPAYALFILAVRLRILRQWRTLLLLAGCLLLGLTPFLYYPLRSPSAPFGPRDMRTWAGFWRHATAQGLRVNLFHFGLADQLDRALVFWSLLRLQFLLPVIALIVVGLVWLVRRAPKPAVLICSFLLTHLLFTLNTVQDVMAYLLLPFAALSIAAGLGAIAFASLLARPIRNVSFVLRHLSFVILLFPWPFLQAAQKLSRGISLRDFTAAEEWVAAVHQRFDGRGEGAILLSDWEHLTPLEVYSYTQGATLDEEDVELVYASTAKTWAEWVWEYIAKGTIYLPNDQEAVRREGFHLAPEGAFYRVVTLPMTDPEPSQSLDIWADERVHILGYDLPTTTVHAGEPLELTLYQSAPEPLEGIWMPYAQLGPVEARWTTDNRLLTTQWLSGEVAAERYELPIPFNLPPGEYPLRLGYADLTGGRAELSLSTGETTIELATVTVLPNPQASPAAVLERALANLDNQAALMGARARAGWQVRQALWEEPLVVRAGRALHLTLTWRALASPRDDVKIFIHLMDGAGRPVFVHDYHPLGGACPSYLWFPKWLPGQTFTDPYRLVLPDGLPPGDYWLEVGMYERTSLCRLPVVNLYGDLAGDRVILGPVRVE